jgi:hypothetical protein
VVPIHRRSRFFESRLFSCDHFRILDQMETLNKFHTNAITFLGYTVSVVAGAQLENPMLFFAGAVMFSVFNGRMRGVRNVNGLFDGTLDPKRLRRVIAFNTFLAIACLVATVTLPAVVGMFTSYAFGLAIAWCVIDLFALRAAEMK